MNLYQEKDKMYFTRPRIDLIGLIPINEDNKILEIGAGGGDTLIEIKKLKLAKEVVGIELMKLDGSQQENPGIDKLIFGNIETMDIDLPKDYFDVIIIGDVLEHLLDPWNTLIKIQAHIKESGILIASIPNFREYHNLYKIFILGDFKYEVEGILDRTHLRFFCKTNIISLFTSTNYTLVSIHSNFKIEKKFSKKKLFDKLLIGLLRDFLTRQYIVIAKKNSLS